MRNGPVWLVGIVCFALLCAYAVWHDAGFGRRPHAEPGLLAAGVIPIDLATRARSGLRRAGLGQLRVYADGRDLTVYGTAATPQEVSHARDIVATTHGVRKVHTAVDVEAPRALSFRFVLADSRLDGSRSLLMIGTMPDRIAQARVVDFAREYFELVDDQLIADRSVNELGFPAIAEIAVLALNHMAQGTAQLRDGVLSLRGTVESDVAARAIKRTLAELPTGFELAPLQLAVGKASNTRPTGDSKIRSKAMVATEQGKQESKSGTGESESTDGGDHSGDDCQRWANQLGQVKVRYRPNRANIDYAYARYLGRVAALASRCRNLKLRIKGHADAVGPKPLNQRLSLYRAKVVRSRLLRLGVRPSQLRIIPFGERRPVASNNTSRGRAQNRRVVVDVAL